MCKKEFETENFKFFQNMDCEYFPCHKTENPDEFNCLFCYCPLYALGRDCGGGFEYTEKGIKNCTNCLVPHKKENYDRIIEKLLILIERVREQ